MQGHIIGGDWSRLAAHDSEAALGGDPAVTGGIRTGISPVSGIRLVGQACRPLQRNDRDIVSYVVQYIYMYYYYYYYSYSCNMVTNSLLTLMAAGVLIVTTTVTKRFKVGV